MLAKWSDVLVRSTVALIIAPDVFKFLGEECR
jgi:hypothetical protein